MIRNVRRLDWNTSNGLRRMWTNRARGNVSSSSLMRQVCGGDLRTSGHPYLHVSFFRNSPSASCQRLTSSAGTPRKVR
jgi:hypothetical protein